MARASSNGAESGFTLIELLMVVALIGIVSGIGMAVLLGARVSANEAAAIASTRAVISAQVSYSSSAAPGTFAWSLGTLATPCPGESVGFLPSDLGSDPSRKSGYIIALGPGTSAVAGPDCNGTATGIGYYVTAVPAAVGTSGLRGFAATSRAVIYFAPGVAPTEAEMMPGGTGNPIQ